MPSKDVSYKILFSFNMKNTKIEKRICVKSDLLDEIARRG